MPKIHLPNYREFYEPRHFASGAGIAGGDDRVRRAARRRSAPTCCSRPRMLPGLDHRRRDLRGLLGAGAAELPKLALAGATVLANLSASNITIGKARDRARCCASRNRRAASRPISMPRPARANRPPTSPGTARPRSSRTARCWPRPSAFRQAGQIARRRHRPRPAAAGARRRWAPSTTTAGATRGALSAGSRFALKPPAGDIGLQRTGRALPVRAGRSGAARAGLLRGLQHPGRRAWCSGCARPASSAW